MGQQTFDMIMLLAGLGYTVLFRKNTSYPAPMQVMCIEVSKDGNYSVYNVDISHHSITTLSTDSLIANGLERARCEFEYQHGEEK